MLCTINAKMRKERMSLEAKIELLTRAIDKLNANMALLLTTPANQVLTTEQVEAAPVVEVKTEAPKVEKVEQVTITHNDLQSLILSKVRDNMDHKPTAKAILKEFGAAKVSDLSEDKLQAVYDKVSAL
jgi:hypothetical protein